MRRALGDERIFFPIAKHGTSRRDAAILIPARRDSIAVSSADGCLRRVRKHARKL